MAEEHFRGAQVALRERGDPRAESAFQCEHALLALQLGRTEEARQEWSTGAAVLEKVGDVLTLGRLSAAMKRACAKAGVTPFDEPTA